MDFGLSHQIYLKYFLTSTILMIMKLLCCVFIILTVFNSITYCESQLPEDSRKRTVAGKYISAFDAYQRFLNDQEGIIILDVRTVEEYVFVGHPEMAYNIPIALWTGEYNEQRNFYIQKDNTNFIAEVKAKFHKDKTIMIICRSGYKSANAANRLTNSGFVNVYNIVDGFEGDIVSDKNSKDYGKRVLNGWKNSDAPWTYKLDPKLIYRPKAD